MNDPALYSNFLNYNNEFNNSLCFLTLNIRSIFKNLDLLLVFISSIDIQIDVIILCECWTGQRDPPSVDNYNAFFTKRSFNQNDGVVVYVRNNLIANCFEPEISEGNCLILEIDNNYSIICSYRPPCFTNPSEYIKSLDYILTNINYKNNVIFTGDININVAPGADPTKYTLHYLNLMASAVW